MTKLTLLALGLVTLTLPAADWSDTSLGFRTGNKFQEPGIADAIKKDIIFLNHVSGYSLGSNFFNVDMLKSDSKDPMNSEGPGKSGGAQEVYIAYRHALSLSKLTGHKIEFGPVRDMELTAGFDYNAKNTQFAPSVFKVLAGPTFCFKVPGFLNVSLLYYKEKNHNAYGTFTPGGSMDVSFDPTFQVAAAWGIALPLGGVETKFRGFGTHTGAKGKDGGLVQTKPETLIDAFWMFDASPVFRAKKGTFQVGPGFQYWNAKFGNPTFEPGDKGGMVNPRTTCFQVALEYHF